MEKQVKNKQIQELLETQQQAFGHHMSELGKIESLPFEIKIKEKAKPFYTAPYNLNAQAMEEIKKQTLKLLEEGLVEYSNSPWQAACIAVLKKPDPTTKEATWRICQDWRGLNERTEANRNAFPKIDHVLSYMGQWKYYTTLDIFSGFHHIPLQEEDRNYFAYGVAGIGQVRPTRMFYGAKNAPAHFQKTMEHILRPVIYQGWIYVYIDDITIGANTLEEMIRKLKVTFNLLIKGGLKCKLTKCQFMKEEVEILGWIIGKGKRRITPRRRKVIEEWKFGEAIPSFLGIMNFLMKAIKNCATLTETLRQYEKHKNNEPEARTAFEILKKRAIQSLISPDFTKPMEIYTDASGDTIGGALTQEGRIIEWFSKKLKTNEQKWFIDRKEALAVKVSVTKFNYYLKPYTADHPKYGKMIKLYCDNEKVVRLLNNENIPLSNELQTILAEVMDMNIEIKHIKGSENILADALTRNKLGENKSNSQRKRKKKKRSGKT